MGIADACIANNQNYRELFYLSATPHWLTGRFVSPVGRVSSVVNNVSNWNMADTVAQRWQDVDALLSNQVFIGSKHLGDHRSIWNALVQALPQDMTLDELAQFLGAGTEAEQENVLNRVNQRLTGAQSAASGTQKKIRILTMHGAKGLSGKVVFIPGAEQGIMPSSRSLAATGLVMEQRRLFYVSVTRAMAACIVTHAAMRTGAPAFALQQKPTVRLTRSQFLNEMGATSINRTSGLGSAEAAAIVADINNL